MSKKYTSDKFVITGYESDSTRFLKSDGSLDSTVYAPLNSPGLTGVPTAPTASPGTNTTQIATTAFVLANVGVLRVRVLQDTYQNIQELLL